jgi:putative endonuclease
MSEFRKVIGGEGERLAAIYLEERGMRVIGTNIKNKIGEMDILALDGGTLVVVEVKTKTGIGFGSPEEMVGFRKQRKLIRCAQLYLLQQKLIGRPWRIDVVSVRMDEDPPRVTHIENAVESIG